MKYVKIKGSNYNEVMMKLKMEYGDDAIPISHKNIKEGGFFNSRLFAKEVVELTAAVQEKKFKSGLLPGKKRIDVTVGDTSKDDTNLSLEKVRDDILNLTTTTQRQAEPELKKIDESANEDRRSSDKSDSGDTASFNESLSSVVKQSRTLNTQPDDTGMRKDRSLERDLDEIKRAIFRISTTGDNGQGSYTREDQSIKPFREVLKNNDFDDDECNRIIKDMKNSISHEDMKDRYKIEKTLKGLLKSRIVTTGPIETSGRKKIIMFIGPTGVGKTTTMAKLGAINALREGQNVAFITIDNYRIAATEQLKKYAEIMSIPVHVVSDQDEFKEIIKSDKADIIMVDTSGRSHKNDLKISEIKSFADSIDADFENILCVSANTKKRDLVDVFKAFSAINFNSIIITKVDETSYIGNVVDVADKYNKPISYFTNGQEVPNDIVVADPDKLVDMMIGNVNN